MKFSNLLGSSISTLGPTKLIKSTKKKNESKTESSPSLLSDYSKIVQEQIGSAPKSSGSGASSINLKPMIGAYTQGANAQKSVIKNESTSKRNSLLDTIKRLQEDTALGRKKQQEIYNAARGDLEDNAFMKTRAIRASKSAKGMGASGLEDIALLRDSMETGNAISGIANKNIEEQGALTTDLNRGTQDANNAIQSAITEEALKLSGIDADLAQQIASLQLQEKQRVASSRSSGNSAINAYNANKLAVENSIRDAQSTAKGVLSKYLNLSSKEQKKSSNKESALNSLIDLKSTYGSILPDSDIEILSKQIKTAYKKAGGK